MTHIYTKSRTDREMPMRDGYTRLAAAILAQSYRDFRNRRSNPEQAKDAILWLACSPQARLFQDALGLPHLLSPLVRGSRFLNQRKRRN